MEATLLNQSDNGQIKLREISLFNWGSFADLHTAHIDPNGTLITGDNGAGKSTLVDGLMALLMPPSRANFNIAAAQNDKADRTILSYMRGSYGQEHDGTTTATKSKRSQKVVTGLRAYYRQDNGNDITLIALFWADNTATSASDVKRLYLVANRDVKLKTVLAEFDEKYDRTFKTWLESQHIKHMTTFDEYQKLYQEVLHLNNKNAPALLSRALGLKKIDNLTDLIRTLVLEPSNLREDAQAIVKEFQDLKKEHDILVDAQEQVQRLEQLPILAKRMEEAKQQLSELEVLKDAIPIYLAKIEQHALAKELAVLEADYRTIETAILDKQTQLEQTRQTAETYRDEYMKLGGNRIESLQKDINYTQDGLRRTSKNASAYQQLCEVLDITTNLTRTTFIQHQQQATNNQAILGEQYTTAQNNFGLATGKFSQTQQDLCSVESEIEQIRQRPDSNIPLRLQHWRDTLCQELNLSQNTKFIGEMLDIEDNQTAWQGAIERALGGLKTTLLVSKQDYPAVTSYINTQRHTGLHLRVQVVENTSATATEFSANGFLRKLKWREHPYRDWLKGFLKKYDLTCVDDSEQLDNTPFSMTITGLIHREWGRFEKKDTHKIDDRREWQLGFNNQSLLNSLLSQQQTFKTQLVEQGKILAQARQAMTNIEILKNRWHKLLETNWDDINAPFWQTQLDYQQQELATLENAQGDIAKAKQLYQQAEQNLNELQSQLIKLNRKEGAKSQELKSHQLKITQNDILANHPMSEAIIEQLDKKFKQIAHNADVLKTRLNEDIESASNRISRDSKSAIGIMGNFKGNEKWQPITSDWSATEQGMPDFLAHYDHLIQEGLAKLTTKFKSRMNNNLTQSLANFKTKMNSELEQIKQGIEQVNLVLQKTEFRQGTFLRLKIKPERIVNVVEFNKQLAMLMELMTTEEHEKRFKLLSDINAVLDKAANGTTASNLESLRLLDPRYQMSFNAEEFKIDSETGDDIVIDILSSSSGKSGGEKESFAGIIVAASLAYVLTPTGGDKPIYSTVFLDEAFSNTQESVSRRVLKVFKELNIHINLITPYKNLNLAREAANSLIICERNINDHESRLTEVTWQDYDKQKAQQQTSHLNEQLAEMNIQITHVET